MFPTANMAVSVVSTLPSYAGSVRTKILMDMTNKKVVKFFERNHAIDHGLNGEVKLE